MTYQELLKIARKERPNVQYTMNRKETAIAGRVSSDEPWRTCAGLGIDGKWYSVGDLFINDKPVNAQEDWI